MMDKLRACIVANYYASAGLLKPGEVSDSRGAKRLWVAFAKMCGLLVMQPTLGLKVQFVFHYFRKLQLGCQWEGWAVPLAAPRCSASTGFPNGRGVCQLSVLLPEMLHVLCWLWQESASQLILAHHPAGICKLSHLNKGEWKWMDLELVREKK